MDSGHPLYRAAKAGKTLVIEDVLKHTFVCPDRPAVGEVGAHQSPGGWRDDRFPRHLEFVTSSLKMMEQIVISGAALAYLPDYYAKDIPVEILKISGCPYVCKQTASLVVLKPKEIGWPSRLF